MNFVWHSLAVPPYKGPVLRVAGLKKENTGTAVAACSVVTVIDPVIGFWPAHLMYVDHHTKGRQGKGHNWSQDSGFQEGHARAEGTSGK